MTDFTKIQLRRDSAADWITNDPTLAEGEVGLEIDTNRKKVGDGSTAWTSLSYDDGQGISALTDQATLTPDGDDGSVFTCTLGGNRTLANIANKVIGRTYTFVFTQDTTGSRTLAYGTDYDFSGSNKIGLTPSTITVIKATVISSSSVRCYIVGPKKVDFDVKDLKINVGGADSLTLTAVAIQYTNANGETIIEPNVNDAWVPSTDFYGGETGTASQWSQGWRDSAALMILTLCEEGSADGTTAGYLDASGNTLYSRGAVKGDYLFNTTDFTYTKISVTPTADNQDIQVDDDIFTSGEGYKLVKVNPPPGMGEFVACLGLGKQDAGEDLVDCGYTKPKAQDWASYSVEQLDFTITGAADWSATNFSSITPFQTFLFGMTPKWNADIKISGQRGGSGTSDTLTISGITFDSVNQSMNAYTTSGEAASGNVRVNASTGTLYYIGENATEKYINGIVSLLLKPSFATRS